MYDDEEDEVVRRLMHAVGQRRVPPPEREAIWRARFETELAPVWRRRRRRRLLVLAAAASVALTVVTWFLAPVAQPEALGRVVHVTGRAESGASALVPGDALHDGDVLRTAPQSYLAFEQHDVQIRFDGNTTVRLERARLALERGSIYVRTSGRTDDRQHVTIDTPLGAVTDVGTEFVVSFDGDELTTAVRRGRVLLRLPSGVRELNATARGAALARVRRAEITETTTPHHGGPWAWVYAAAPPFDADGQPVHGFLSWVAAEAGLRVEYVDAAAEQHAGRAVLSGDLSGVPIAQALEVVSQTTALDVHLAEGAIRVALDRTDVVD